jgi:hypothetical protein
MEDEDDDVNATNVTVCVRVRPLLLEEQRIGAR